jgi:NAD(P)-dependent dehydrogenase (short-subunit alcohol dehydrogenase family)
VISNQKRGFGLSKKVLVTGGAGGLGLAIVEKHLSFGDTVWALDVEESPGIVELMARDKRVAYIQCDISKTINVQSAFESLTPAIDKLDYLYNCAGIYRFEDKEPLPDTILDNAASMYEINAVGFLRVVQTLLHTFQDGSVIMCITSEAGSVSENWRATEYNYCMSKAAENMACVILQKHFDEIPLNTRVMAIHPGWLRTKMGGKGAFENPQYSVAPDVSAEGIVGIALDIDNIPKERMYMDYKRMDIGW